MDTARTSLVAHLISPMRAITTTPVGFMRVIRFSPHKQRPSPLLWRVGTYDDVSRPAQCSLTLWPAWPTDLLKRPFLEVLQHIRYLLHRSKCFRPKRKKCRIGFAPTNQMHLSKAHTTTRWKTPFVPSLWARRTGCLPGQSALVSERR
jgi:hypothetical protein